MSGLQQPVIGADGERVIPGSRRPDGTWRKERRVRDGYTPQEEQPVYQSRGVMAKQNVPICPGMDNDEVQALQVQAKSKAQKKNEKRKEKTDTNATGAVTAGVAALKVSEVKKQAAAPAPVAPAPAAAEPEDPRVRAEKELRKVQKKIRECDALVEKKSKGEALTAPEQEKLSKLAGWQQDVKKLEEEISKLAA
uniref:WIBG Mago-binding domain-containing protein n=1 Tax=Chlamydomonas chlamydogama TaxID=225041 RepID=A0A7S2VUU1_9CHLO|mmetsp:Transcript_1887/g.4209  ORF Transcript_1887/g.4209 Transcript_1887/m.4209 type:complete len:194 (+) Transcript_1887:57-638(+)